MSDHLKGLLSLHAGLLLFGGTALFSQTIALNALDMTTWRCLVAAVLLLGWLKIRNQPVVFTNHRYWLGMFGLSVLMGLHWITYFHAMQVAGVAVGMLSLFTFPVITVLLEPLFDKTRLRLGDLGAALLVILGVVLMTPALDSENPISVGIFWGVVSAFLFTLRNLIQKRYFSHYSPLLTMGWQTLFVMLMLLPFTSEAVAELGYEQWLQILLLGTVFTAAPHTLLANSLRYLKAASISLISCLQPVYGVVLAFLLLGDQPALMTLLGGTLILAAAIKETLKKRC
ncbi:EamA domain-containing membrane protein RarD [Oceanospirillum multiglobuliferum]|uniref:EamA domain-containing protein n=1 Tax=Oceanospirillum multiglobuliferum TaxID=64969 RepID=A0A1T4N4L7_9GAMM|nr:DMT family transporter [Oceanospirillum multiglobuliferum]OPX55831.1 hypothetical protein BTE48_06415 [Oceanospirillum multiglobuliferum]SJZ74031.1 EamA domain-containing membrane protein RarD [Oceanospirillum multiglobuliferum]